MREGKFKAKATDAGLGMTGTGKEQIAILFEITEDGDCHGQVITWFGMFTEGTMARTIESLRHCGWTGDDLSEFCEGLRPANATIETMLPNEVEIVVELKDEHMGERKLEVRWVNKIGNGVALKTRLDAGAAKAFAARMKGACKASPVKAAPKPATPPAEKRMRQLVEDDDIPPWM